MKHYILTSLALSGILLGAPALHSQNNNAAKFFILQNINRFVKPMIAWMGDAPLSEIIRENQWRTGVVLFGLTGLGFGTQHVIQRIRTGNDHSSWGLNWAIWVINRFKRDDSPKNLNEKALQQQSELNDQKLIFDKMKTITNKMFLYFKNNDEKNNILTTDLQQKLPDDKYIEQLGFVLEKLPALMDQEKTITKNETQKSSAQQKNSEILEFLKTLVKYYDPQLSTLNATGFTNLHTDKAKIKYLQNTLETKYNELQSLKLGLNAKILDLTKQNEKLQQDKENLENSAKKKETLILEKEELLKKEKLIDQNNIKDLKEQLEKKQQELADAKKNLETVSLTMKTNVSDALVEKQKLQEKIYNLEQDILNKNANITSLNEELQKEKDTLLKMQEFKATSEKEELATKLESEKLEAEKKLLEKDAAIQQLENQLATAKQEAQQKKDGGEQGKKFEKIYEIVNPLAKEDEENHKKEVEDLKKQFIEQHNQELLRLTEQHKKLLQEKEKSITKLNDEKMQLLRISQEEKNANEQQKKESEEYYQKQLQQAAQKHEQTIEEVKKQLQDASEKQQQQQKETLEKVNLASQEIEKTKNELEQHKKTFTDQQKNYTTEIENKNTTIQNLTAKLELAKKTALEQEQKHAKEVLALQKEHEKLASQVSEFQQHFNSINVQQQQQQQQQQQENIKNVIKLNNH